MKITKKEVRTLCTVEIKITDVEKAFENARQEVERWGSLESFKISYGNAFANLLNKNDDELKMGFYHDYCRKVLDQYFNPKTNEFGCIFLENDEHTATMRYITKFFGFDGIDFYGNYNKEFETLRFTAYYYGERM